ncbi:MAG: 16S rRNA (cytidine(1402)-2'-O)-methyltransferase [Hyphomicrobiales bacterium]
MANDGSQETASDKLVVHSHLTNQPIEPALYIVATPIGNLGDITLRALNVLQNADAIACEDTRVTGKLLKHFGIKTKMIAYHDHNAEKQSPFIMTLLGEGKSVALVSDAGTPLVSDPGYRLIKDAIVQEYKVVPLPGASAPITALSAAGLPNDAFLFAGFLPPKQAARRVRLEAWATTPATLIFFESPRRIAATLQDAAHVLGGSRQAVVARELTKLFETFRRASLEELAASFAEEPTPKGEIVLLIEPVKERSIDIESVDEQLLELLQTLRVKDASEQLSRETGLPKRDLYQRALMLKEQAKDG